MYSLIKKGICKSSVQRFLCEELRAHGRMRRDGKEKKRGRKRSTVWKCQNGTKSRAVGSKELGRA